MESGDNVSEGYRDLNVLIIFCTLSEDSFFGKTSDQPESAFPLTAEGALDDAAPGADKAWHFVTTCDPELLSKPKKAVPEKLNSPR